MIASIAFCLSLTTGKMVSNVISSMLETSSTTQNQLVMQIPSDKEQNNDTSRSQPDKNLLNKAMTSPENEELDVSLTGQTVIQLAEITAAICIVSVILPTVYILRLSPREVLTRKEG